MSLEKCTTIIHQSLLDHYAGPKLFKAHENYVYQHSNSSKTLTSHYQWIQIPCNTIFPWESNHANSANEKKKKEKKGLEVLVATPKQSV
jgi:hypothetical protein